MVKRNVLDLHTSNPSWVTKTHKTSDAAIRAAKKDSKSGKHSIVILSGSILSVVPAK